MAGCRTGMLRSVCYRRTGTVFILTGFYILKAGIIETDGLTGTWVLSQVMRALDRQILIPTDQQSYPVLSRIFPAGMLLDYPLCEPQISKQRAATILDRYSPSAIIAIERPGPGSDGVFRNADGRDISDFCARMEYLWPADRLTIGIGDGGNELGMGRLAAMLTDSRPLCFTAADCTLIGSTSDFAAWCLGAALEITTRRDLLPDPDALRALILDLAEMGVVDGMSGKPVPGIDGYDLDTILDRYRLIRLASAEVRKAQSIVESFKEINSEKYPVSLIEISPRFDPSTREVNLDGFVLLQSQLAGLSDMIQSAEVKIARYPVVLAEPALSSRPWLSVTGLTCDLHDRPAGQLTTQIADYDCWVRKILTLDDWILIQTPDLAFGWTADPAVRGLQGSFPDANPWQSISRPFPGILSPDVRSLNALLFSAERLAGVPYVWGGRNRTGLDCSGMTQYVYHDLGLLLPRHSGDQRHCGIRIPFSGLKPGDLLFATSLVERFQHTAIVLPQGIQHACRTRKQVIVESIEQFQTHYRLIAARRISTFA